MLLFLNKPAASDMDLHKKTPKQTNPNSFISITCNR